MGTAREDNGPRRNGKLMVLFQHVPLADSGTLSRALKTLEGFCGKQSLARVYAAITSRGQSR